jgi:hypothetical protein
MDTQPTKHYLVEALLYYFPRKRIRLYDGTMKQIQTILTMRRLSTAIGVDFTHTLICKH